MIGDQEVNQRRVEIEQHSQEFHEAVAKLREATKNPLGLADRIRDNPLPWLVGGVLVGVWIGSRK
jgi:hypothetical protein